MQTLLAFAFDAAVPAERVEAGLRRVATWYEPARDAPVPPHRARGGRTGLVLWPDPEDRSRWPAWVQAGGRTVASLHTPLGHEQLVSTGGPLALAAHLRRRPADVHRLTPPFVLAELDAVGPALTLVTDGLGLGRLHEVRTAAGWFWSNRPVAALLFAGETARPDPEAWARMAACDWAMGEATPYAGVSVVPAATRVVVDDAGVAHHRRDVLADLLGRRRDPLTPASLDQTAEALTATARAVAATWPGTPVLSLSGGRDSRLVVAAFVAAGVPVALRTYGGDPGEVTTAERLVALAPTALEHEVTTPGPRRPAARRTGALDRARRWHDVTEGLRPSSYLPSGAPRRLLRHHPPLVTGVGGEFGHAPGYPDDVERLEALPLPRRLDAFTRALLAKTTLPRGVAPEALAATERQVRRVLEHAAARGADDAKALDWFYADERLRRWGMAGESGGRVMPLLGGDVVAAALGLTTAESRASALHTALVGRLVPAWAGIPFHSATLRQRQRVPRQRLWEEDDADLVGDLLREPDSWGGSFDVPRVQALWDRARAGRAGPRDELLLQRVVWRAAFTDHLAAVGRGTGATRPRVRVRTGPATGGPATAPGPAPRRPTRRSAVTLLATWANDVPLARRLARTRVGRQVRRVLGA